MGDEFIDNVVFEGAKQVDKVGDNPVRAIFGGAKDGRATGVIVESNWKLNDLEVALGVDKLNGVMGGSTPPCYKMQRRHPMRFLILVTLKPLYC